MSSSGHDEESSASPSSFEEDVDIPDVVEHEVTAGQDQEAQTGHSSVDQTDTDSTDSGESDKTRFQGPESTWRFFTRKERALITSLNQQRANDLSVHLYNTHALKERLHALHLASQPGGSFEQSSRSQNSQDGQTFWKPDNAWTAWPLLPDDVPRHGEDFGVSLEHIYDEEAYRLEEPWNPSTDLEEDLVATILRQGKEAFCKRLAANSNPNLSKSLEIDYRYDDDRNSEMLRPIIRHILTKFDDVLMGLHESRQIGIGQSSQSSFRRSKARPRDSRSRSKSQIRTERSLSQTSSGSASPTEPEDPVVETDHDKEPPRKIRRRARPLVPRGWAEVLSVASFAGWDHAVLDRASKRCNALFGNDPHYQSLRSAMGGGKRPEAANDVDTLPPASIDVTFASKSSVPTVVVRLHCPYESCRRRSKPFERPFRWREHMKRTHKYSREQIERLERQMKSGNELVLPLQPGLTIPRSRQEVLEIADEDEPLEISDEDEDLYDA